MARILLGVTGSVAASRTPALFRTLRDAGHAVRVLVTDAALYFFDPADLDLGPPEPHGSDLAIPLGPVIRDDDEWPAPSHRRGAPVLHIELRRWADLLVVAPLDANTLAKFALGLSDNALTCVFRAWDFARPVVLAPAMNTLMWESPVTRRHLAQILEDRGDGDQPVGWTLADADSVFARHATGIVLVPPQAKRLACGDVGLGAMAEVASIAESVRLTMLEKESVAGTFGRCRDDSADLDHEGEIKHEDRESSQEHDQ